MLPLFSNASLNKARLCVNLEQIRLLCLIQALFVKKKMAFTRPASRDLHHRFSG
jgi:hypothetical protein